MRNTPSIISAVAITILSMPWAFAGQNVLHEGTGACSDCHVSSAPTLKSAELKGCTRSGVSDTDVKEAPDVFIIGEISDIYVPVVFPHKLHAAMTEMSGGCDNCHHENPEPPILQCRECHGGPSNPVNLRQPSLKGAYHRQCLGCHREWSHDTDCVVCHAKRDPNVAFKPPTDETDIMGVLHPNIEVPDKKIYLAEDVEDAPMITFHHRDHTRKFGLSCASCHQQENCGSCHDMATERVARVREDPHQDCVLCHQPQTEGNCTFCHDTVERGPFDHEERSGFSLATWHAGATCQQCHTEERGFENISSDCATCHDADWFPEEDSFDHMITGVPLDETHAMVPCMGCHGQGLGAPTACDACHDDGRTVFPEEFVQSVIAAQEEAAGETEAPDDSS